MMSTLIFTFVLMTNTLNTKQQIEMFTENIKAIRINVRTANI